MQTLPRVSSGQEEESIKVGKWVANIKENIYAELKKQWGIAAPLIPMNSTWFAKTAITTAILGRLGKLQLAAGMLGFTFANVTGFSILTGLCWAMEPICGQAHGAKNQKLLHRTLCMTTILLLMTSIPIFLLWLFVGRILVLVGQQREIASLSKMYVLYLLLDLFVTSILCPLKGYLISQGIILPILVSSIIALAFHLPINIVLSKINGLKGVSTATGLTDLVATIILALYVLLTERKKAANGKEGKLTLEEGGEWRSWWGQSVSEWLRLLRLSVQCCFTGCLEWWCYEILILLAGRLCDAQQAMAVLTVVLNFDYLLYAVMVSLATCASIRVSNELGAGKLRDARNAAYMSLGLSITIGCIGGSMMVAFRAHWGALFSHDDGVVEGVKNMLLLMALVEVFNFPLAVCGGILRATSKPWLGMCSVGGFYVVGLPLAITLCFRASLGLGGLLLGFVVGSASSAVLLCVLVARIDWVAEAEQAQKIAGLETEKLDTEINNASFRDQLACQ